MEEEKEDSVFGNINVMPIEPERAFHGFPKSAARRVVVTPTISLRIASVLTLLHCIGHTIGGVCGADAAPTPEEAAVIGAMKSHRFEVMGSMRSFWDFFFGYGLFISINFLIQAVLFWQLASFAKRGLKEIRPIIACFFFAYVGFAILAWKYFFVAPAVHEVLIAICLGLALMSLGRLARAPSRPGRSLQPLS